IAAAVPIAELTRAPGWDGVTHEAFDNVFMGSLRMIAASLTAYLVAQFTDIGVFHLLRRLSRGRMLWLRATGSTVVSQAIDTLTISVVAWYGLMGFSEIVNIMLSSYSLKFLVAVGLTPLIYAGHALLARLLDMHPLPPETELRPS